MRLYENPLALSLIALFVVVFAAAIYSGSWDEGIGHGDSDNLISGNLVNTKVEILPAFPKNCSFHLNTGWNMVSFYCFGMYVDRNLAMDSVSGSYASIFAYDPTDATDHWKSYNPYLPGGIVQQVTHMDRVSGYWIFMFNDADYRFGGVYSDSTVPLVNGWNFIGYPLNHSTNISSHLATTNYTVIRYYDSVSNSWLYYVRGGPSNTMTTFNTYRGYWINVSGNSQWNLYRE